MTSLVLALNCGSSSLKFALFACPDGGGESRVADGAVVGIGQAGGRFRLRQVGDAPASDRPAAAVDHATALELALAGLAGLGLAAPSAIGHRLVHGGPTHHAPTRIDAALLAALRQQIAFAPLHLPTELAAIEAVTQRFPAIPQVACFDTGFHHRLPAVARRLPIPRALAERGIYRYGFHGLSYESIVDTVGAARLQRAVIAHLGSGASMAAIANGEPRDTTMGFTPTGGLMMGTRSGDLDPGVLLFLLAAGADARALERIVDHESGLLGVSGRSADVPTLLAVRDTDPDADLALAMFCYHARKAVGSLAAALGGLDTLVFTGGIGEHAAPVRAEICASLTYLGVQLDAARNTASSAVISADGSACTVRVVPTDEERMIARHTRRVLARL